MINPEITVTDYTTLIQLQKKDKFLIRRYKYFYFFVDQLKSLLIFCCFYCNIGQ